jgi:hypothetical protein
MSTAVCERSVDCEQLLYQAAVDNEFRTELLNDPRVFGMDLNNLFLPDSVEQQDQTALKLWSESIAVFQCSSSCSAGPITVVCDGGTK